MLSIFSSLLKYVGVSEYLNTASGERWKWKPGIWLLRSDEKEREFILCVREFSGRVPSLEKPPAINLNYMSSLVFPGEGDNITANLLRSHSYISRSVLLQLSTAMQGQPKKETETEHCFMWRKSSCYPWLSQLTDNRLIHFEVCKGLR